MNFHLSHFMSLSYWIFEMTVRLIIKICFLQEYFTKLLNQNFWKYLPSFWIHDKSHFRSSWRIVIEANWVLTWTGHHKMRISEPWPLTSSSKISVLIPSSILASSLTAVNWWLSSINRFFSYWFFRWSFIWVLVWILRSNSSIIWSFSRITF